MSPELVELKGEIRSQIESEFGEGVQIEFVEDTNRLDVRVSDLGLVEELRARNEDVAVSKYSDLRFTVMKE